MTTSADVLIVGGGIAGLTTALAAARRGLVVTLIDETRPGAASRAAAGMLAPSVEGLSPDAKSVAIRARDLYPEFLADLREQTGIEVPLDRNGILQLAETRVQWEELTSQAALTAQCLDDGDLARLEPALAGHAGAVLHAFDGAVDNVTLMRALDVAVERQTRIGRLRDTVVRVAFPRGMATVTTAGGSRFDVPRMILATGAWAAALKGLPKRLPVHPLRGQLLRLHGLPIRHVTYACGGYLVPRGGTLLVGATSEAVGFANETTAEGVSALRSIATRAIAALSSAEVVEHWAGLRPVTPDALPILGPDPDVPQLAYACGFSRNGILLAPWAASKLGDMLAGERTVGSLALFSCRRFEA